MPLKKKKPAPKGIPHARWGEPDDVSLTTIEREIEENGRQIAELKKDLADAEQRVADLRLGRSRVLSTVIVEATAGRITDPLAAVLRCHEIMRQLPEIPTGDEPALRKSLSEPAKRALREHRERLQEELAALEPPTNRWVVACQEELCPDLVVSGVSVEPYLKVVSWPDGRASADYYLDWSFLPEPGWLESPPILPASYASDEDRRKRELAVYADRTVAIAATLAQLRNDLRPLVAKVKKPQPASRQDLETLEHWLRALEQQHLPPHLWGVPVTFPDPGAKKAAAAGVTAEEPEVPDFAAPGPHKPNAHGVFPKCERLVVPNTGPLAQVEFLLAHGPDGLWRPSFNCEVGTSSRSGLPSMREEAATSRKSALLMARNDARAWLKKLLDRSDTTKTDRARAKRALEAIENFMEAQRDGGAKSAAAASRKGGSKQPRGTGLQVFSREAAEAFYDAGEAQARIDARAQNTAADANAGDDPAPAKPAAPAHKKPNQSWYQWASGVRSCLASRKGPELSLKEGDEPWTGWWKGRMRPSAAVQKWLLEGPGQVKSMDGMEAQRDGASKPAPPAAAKSVPAEPAPAFPRPADGASITQAAANLASIVGRVAPDRPDDARPRVVPIRLDGAEWEEWVVVLESHSVAQPETSWAQLQPVMPAAEFAKSLPGHDGVEDYFGARVRVNGKSYVVGPASAGRKVGLIAANAAANEKETAPAPAGAGAGATN